MLAQLERRARLIVAQWQMMIAAIPTSRAAASLRDMPKATPESLERRAHSLQYRFGSLVLTILHYVANANTCFDDYSEPEIRSIKCSSPRRKPGPIFPIDTGFRRYDEYKRYNTNF